MAVPHPHGNVIPVRIAGTCSIRPGRVVTTAELAQRVRPQRDAAELEARTGIARRNFVDPESTAADLSAQALRQALADAELRPTDLARIIFVDSVGGDVLGPATANRVAVALDLEGTCDCFDLHNACMGFLTAFDVGARSVATGCGPVAIVVAELLSRFITPDDPRPFLVLGDGVAAVVLDRARSTEGILGSSLHNNGKVAGDVRIEHPGLTGQRETIRFGMTSEAMSRIAIDAVRRSAEAVLSQAGLGLSEVQWIVPHQPNGTMLAAIVRELGLDADRVIQMVEDVGSIGAASIPTSLDRLLRTRPVRPGDCILMVGVGAGMSAGAILLQV